jgi:NAD(P)-dependent dehydrogenase (short-subunit alcohol dehydrogenase family)
VIEIDLSGRVAIVTGGSRGLGRADALTLERAGAQVVTFDVEEANTTFTCDVSDRAQVDEAVARTVEQHGGVDILVNNAGTSSAGPFEKVDDATWVADIDVKLMAAIRLCRLVIPQMKKRGGGRIVNVTTVGGKVPVARALPTSVTRAAGINLTKSLANEYASDHILVNTVCLGLVKSAQWERRAKGDLEGYYREVAKRVPVGRVGEAEEFADLVAFLCSARAAYITGTAINFDGGMSAAF